MILWSNRNEKVPLCRSNVDVGEPVDGLEVTFQEVASDAFDGTANFVRGIVLRLQRRTALKEVFVDSRILAFDDVSNASLTRALRWGAAIVAVATKASPALVALPVLSVPLIFERIVEVSRPQGSLRRLLAIWPAIVVIVDLQALVLRRSEISLHIRSVLVSKLIALLLALVGLRIQAARRFFVAVVRIPLPTSERRLAFAAASGISTTQLHPKREYEKASKNPSLPPNSNSQPSRNPQNNKQPWTHLAVAFSHEKSFESARSVLADVVAVLRILQDVVVVDLTGPDWQPPGVLTRSRRTRALVRGALLLAVSVVQQSGLTVVEH